MLLHSRYIEYANAIAERDGMLGMVAIYVLCVFVIAFAVATVFPRVKREWFVLGAFYATFIIVGLVPIIAGH